MNEKTIDWKLEIIIDGKQMETLTGGFEYDEKFINKWSKIEKICNYYKTSITSVIDELLEELTPEKVEEILWNRDH